VLSVNPDALEEAAASDRHRAEDGARSPLEGIPVGAKFSLEIPGSLSARVREPNNATEKARPPRPGLRPPQPGRTRRLASFAKFRCVCPYRIK